MHSPTPDKPLPFLAKLSFGPFEYSARFTTREDADRFLQRWIDAPFVTGWDMPSDISPEVPPHLETVANLKARVATLVRHNVALLQATAEAQAQADSWRSLYAGLAEEMAKRD